jgi:IS30 family transposase
MNSKAEYVLKEILEGVYGNHSGSWILAHKAMQARYYCTKWAEAEALATITTENVTKFLWSLVICQFGIPHAFVTDNGKHFDCGKFCKWCTELRIQNYYSTPTHPPANGQVKATNKTLLKTLKKKLDKKKRA